MTTTLDGTEYVVRVIAQTCIDNEKYFSDLDSVVGDGDFGYSLARGFEQVMANWDDYDRSDAGTFLVRVASTISSRIGGTSGPIWGTAFLRAGASLKGKSEVTPPDVVAALRSSIEGIMKRGGASLGDKTLLDALVPAVDALEAALGEGSSALVAVTEMATVARTAAEATVTMQARRGRASYTGERSIGSPDAGAVAVAVLAEKVSDTWSTR